MTTMDTRRDEVLRQLESAGELVALHAQLRGGYTTTLRSAVIRAALLGVPKTDISEAAGVSRQTVHAYLKRGGE